MVVLKYDQISESRFPILILVLLVWFVICPYFLPILFTNISRRIKHPLRRILNLLHQPPRSLHLFGSQHRIAQLQERGAHALKRRLKHGDLLRLSAEDVLLTTSKFALRFPDSGSTLL